MSLCPQEADSRDPVLLFTLNQRQMILVIQTGRGLGISGVSVLQSDSAIVVIDPSNHYVRILHPAIRREPKGQPARGVCLDPNLDDIVVQKGPIQSELVVLLKVR